MNSLDDVRTYLDDLFLTTRGDFPTHLKLLDKVLNRLKMVGLKINARKRKFCVGQVDYLGYTITRSGIKPQLKKLQAIINLSVPQTVKEVRSILGLIQYYRDVWRHRSDILTPLTDLTRTKGTANNSHCKIVWEESHQKSFDKIKEVVTREILLV